VILYVGGIMVLFVFVIMLVNLDVAVRQMRFNRVWFVGLLLALALGAQAFMVFRYARTGDASFFQMTPAAASQLEPNTELVGKSLFSEYMLPFEIASILLLVSMIGAVVMAKKKV
jgi:NADH-quinone oxidoreductase subunit J